MMHYKDIMQTKTYRWIRYLLINGLFAACIYYGLFLGVEGAENVALFMAWWTGLLGAFILLGLSLDKKDELKELWARQDPSPVPFWFDLAFDIVVSLSLIWTGHYILVIFYIISIAAGKTIRDMPQNIMLKNLKSQQS